MKSQISISILVSFISAFAFANTNMGAYTCVLKKDKTKVIQGQIYRDEIGISAISIFTKALDLESVQEKVYSYSRYGDGRSIAFLDFSETGSMYKAPEHYSTYISLSTKNIQLLYKKSTYEMSVGTPERGVPAKRYICQRD